jgi:tRNA A37 threonylcarbamoyltransferase TsaD
MNAILQVVGDGLDRIARSVNVQPEGGSRIVTLMQTAFNDERGAQIQLFEQELEK